MQIYAMWKADNLLKGSEPGISFGLYIDPSLPLCRYFVGGVLIPENYAQTDWNPLKTTKALVDPLMYSKVDGTEELPRLSFPANTKQIVTILSKEVFLPLEDSMAWLLSTLKGRLEELYLEEVEIVLLNKLELPPHLNAFERCWKGIKTLFR